MNDMAMNDWIAAHLGDLEDAWNEWARKETDVFADVIDFYEFCYANSHLSSAEWRTEYKRRVRRGVGRRACA